MAVPAGQFRNHGTEHHLDPVAGVQVEVERRNQRRDDARHQAVGRFQHRHRLALLARGGRDFEADETAADDDHALRRLQRGGDGLRIRQRTQAEDAIEVGTNQRQGAQARAGAQRQAVVGQGRAVGKRELLRRAVYRRHTGADVQRDAFLRHQFRRAHDQLRLLGVAQQVALRQRGAVVGAAGLVAEQGDRTFVALGAQGLGDGESRQPGTDDDHTAHRPGAHDCITLQPVGPSILRWSPLDSLQVTLGMGSPGFVMEAPL